MSKEGAAQAASSNAKADSGGESRLLHHKCACGAHTLGGGACETCKRKGVLNRKASALRSAMEAPPSVFQALNSSGHSMEAPLQAFMETRFQRDFSQVRLHTDAVASDSAKDIHAHAYTVGSDIVFAQGAYQPAHPKGLHLLAHELTHVAQQSSSSATLQSKLEIADEHSDAEREADHHADAVLTPGAQLPGLSKNPLQVNRSLGWGLGGAGIGVGVGVALGALLGPIGAIVGGIAGGLIGAWIGHAASNDKKDDKEGSGLRRIHRLLARDFSDWVVTDAEAKEALAILLGLKPKELFETASIMKLSGDWKTLEEELPPVDRLGLEGLRINVLNPDQGPVMEGDTIHLGIGNESNRTKTDEQMSRDYEVRSDGVRLPYLDKPVQILEMPLQNAVNAIAQAYVDGEIFTQLMEISLSPAKRGHFYYAFGEVVQPTTVHQNLMSNPSEATKRILAKQPFVNYLASYTSTDSLSISASLYYWQELDKNFDKWKDQEPHVLWEWALKQASKPAERAPVMDFLDFGKRQLDQASKQPPEERKRTQDTYSRYIDWVSKHADDPKLTSFDPVKIWVDAYMGVFKQEMAEKDAKYLLDVKNKREDALWKKANEKYMAAIELVITKVLPTKGPEVAEVGEEQLSETTGGPVKVSYLIMPSDAEKIMRQKIASDYMDDVRRRMEKPETFVNSSASEDFLDYLRRNPEQYKAFQLTTAHPYVERHEDKVDIPAWQTATEIVIGFIPFLGNAVALAEIAGGRDLFGHPLSTTDRTILAVGVLLPWAAKGAKLGKGAYTASKIAQEYSLSGAEADRVFRIYMGLKPGTVGARLFGEGLSKIKAGKAVDDPAVLREMEAVLKDVGLTEKETAKALLPSVERQAGEAAKEEVQALKTATGAMTDETTEMLLKNESLRRSLVENSLAATVLKKCASPCFPPEATALHVERLERFLEKIKKTGAYNEEALREFLYKRRGALDSALSDIIGGTNDAAHLNSLLEYFNSGGKITKGVDRAAIAGKVEQSFLIGESGGRAAASSAGLQSVQFENPFRYIGKYGQGFDDVMAKGVNLDKDMIYILEYKGGGATLDAGQMELQWVVDNIQRLYREGGVEGQKWAQKLAAALSEGRLRGRAYSTPITNGAADATAMIKEWNYGKQTVNLVP
jgi:regulator of replication initiation timing